MVSATAADCVPRSSCRRRLPVRAKGEASSPTMAQSWRRHHESAPGLVFNGACRQAGKQVALVWKESWSNLWAFPSWLFLVVRRPYMAISDDLEDTGTGIRAVVEDEGDRLCGSLDWRLDEVLGYIASAVYLPPSADDAFAGTIVSRHGKQNIDRRPVFPWLARCHARERGGSTVASWWEAGNANQRMTGENGRLFLVLSRVF